MGNKLHLNSRFIDMDYDEQCESVGAFLEKCKVPFKKYTGHDTIGNRVCRFVINEPDVTGVVAFLMVEHKDVKELRVRGFYYADDNTRDYLEKLIINCPKDILDFISDNIPTVMTNKVFKKINENSSSEVTLSTDLTKLPFDVIVDEIDNFLEKNNLYFSSSKNTTTSHNFAVGYPEYLTSPKDFKENIVINIDQLGAGIEIPLYYDNEYIFINTLMDLINFISKHKPDLINNQVFKKINEKLTLDANLCELSSDEAIETISNFLTKLKLPFTVDKNFQSATNDDPLQINTTHFYIGDYKEIGESIRVKIDNYDSYIELNMMYRGNKIEGGLTNNKKVETPKDIITYVSHFMPELTNDSVFKKINEGWFSRKKEEEVKPKVSISTKFNDMNYPTIIRHISKFLEKSNIEYEWGVYPTGTNYFVIKGDGNNKQLEIKARRDGDGFKVFAEYIGDVDSGIDTDWGEQIVYNLIDLSMFISKHMPELTNDRVFKKINESEEKVEKGIINKFLVYVNDIPEWNGTNQEVYDSEINDPDDTDDEFYHNYRLYNTLVIELDSNDYDEDVLSMDESIKYFICGFYGSSNETQRDFHVYQNGKFRESNRREDSYLRALDDEIFFSEQDDIITISYFDWKKNIEQTLNAVRNINETKLCTSFNKFKLIYKT
tara:strand:+ start:1055 stop:3040 length:1986 start_codon:yes stop_codon:yes gene_type:complete